MNVRIGDLVLIQVDVNPVMSVAPSAGLDVIALHNHFCPLDAVKISHRHLPDGSIAARLGGLAQAQRANRSN